MPSLFISVSLDDGPGPPIKYQYAELGKLYQVTTLLVYQHVKKLFYLTSKTTTHRQNVKMVVLYSTLV